MFDTTIREVYSLDQEVAEYGETPKKHRTNSLHLKMCSSISSFWIDELCASLKGRGLYEKGKNCNSYGRRGLSWY